MLVESVGGCPSRFLVSSVLSDPSNLSLFGGGGHLVVNIMEVAQVALPLS